MTRRVLLLIGDAVAWVFLVGGCFALAWGYVGSIREVHHLAYEAGYQHASWTLADRMSDVETRLQRCEVVLAHEQRDWGKP